MNEEKEHHNDTIVHGEYIINYFKQNKLPIHTAAEILITLLISLCEFNKMSIQTMKEMFQSVLMQANEQGYGNDKPE